MVQFGIKKELNDNIDLGQIVFYRKKLYDNVYIL